MPCSNICPINFFSAGRSEASVALLPLLLREVRVEHLALVRPVLDLRVEADGRRNWDFAEAEPLRRPGSIRLAQAATGPELRRMPSELQDFARNASPIQTRAERLGDGINAISLADVQVRGGTVRYSDLRHGTRREIADIDMRLAVGDGPAPLDLKGSVKLAGETVAVEARAGSLRDALAERPFELGLKLAAGSVTATAEGKVATGPAPGFEGNVKLKALSLADLGRLLQLPVAGGERLGAVAVEGYLKTSAQGASLANATLLAADTTASGTVSVDVRAARPAVKANLRLSALDLNRLLDTEGEAAPAAPHARPPESAAGAKPARSIDDLPRRTAPDSAPKPGLQHDIRYRP